MLLLVCRKIFSVFYPILHETSSNSCGFALYKNFLFLSFFSYLIFYSIFSFLTYYFIKGNIFVQSWLIWATFHTESHQKLLLISSDLKDVITKHFPKIRSQMFFKIDVPLKFHEIHKKIFVLESHFNKITGLMACNLTKKRPHHGCLPVNITKYLVVAFFIEHFRWLLLKMVEIFVQKNV